MNTDYIIERVLYYILLVLIPFLCYYIGKRMNVGRKNDKRLNILIGSFYASLICLIGILCYTLVREVFDINLKILNALSLVLFPLSIISSLFFVTAYVIRRARKSA